MNFSESGESPPFLVVSDKYEGTGGADYTVLGDESLMSDSNYFCDEMLWKLKSGESGTMMTYGLSTSLGQTFQYDAVPTGINAANFAHGRSALYEVVVGDNGFEHLSELCLYDFFMGKTAGNIQAESQVALTCWKGF